MNIDTKRLAKDRAYWDEVAPEGAEVLIDGVFVKWASRTELRFTGGTWGESLAPWSVKRYIASRLFEIVLRPDAPEQWIGGLPPVGTECEVDDVDQGWISAIVIGRDDAEGVVVCKTAYGYDGYEEFRPLRTPEQREREAFALSNQNAIEDITNLKFRDEDSLSMAESLIDAGYRKSER